MKKFILLLFVLLFLGSSAHAWFYQNEPYRIPIKVTSPSNLTTYQVLIDLNSTSLTGDTNSHFWINTRTDGLDVRFSNKDDNQALDFFREVFTDNSRAKFWVELPTISSGDQNIFMYYGSNSSDDNSSWENTFIDDGNGTTILGWSLSAAGGSNWYSNGTQYQNDSVTGTQQMTRAPPQGSFSNARAYAVSLEMQNTSSTSTELRYFLFDAVNTNSPYVEYHSGLNAIRFLASGDDGPAACSIAISDGATYDVNVTRDYEGTWRLYANNSVCTVTNTTDSSGAQHGATHAGDLTSLLDNIFIKNTNAGGEPTYTIQNFQDDGNTTMRVVDEETGSPLEPTLTVNGSSVDVNANGYFDVNASTLSFPVTISVSLTGYDSRTFVYQTATGLLNDSILGMRSESEANDISFTFFQPDETTTLPSRYIAVKRNGILSGRAQTSATASVSFNLAPQDSSYSFLIYASGSDTNVEYTYGSVSVTVEQARNESNNAIITPNSFTIDVGGLGLQNYSPQTLPFSTIVILGNTVDAYTLRVVDENSNGQQYYARQYLLQTKGDTTTLSLTPYLISISQGNLINFYVKDISTNLTIPGIRLQIKTGINNQIVTVEDRLTNFTGIAQFTLMSQKDYFVYVTNSNQDTNYLNTTLQTPIFSATNEEFEVYIIYNQVDVNYSAKDSGISISPLNQILTGTTANVDVNVAPSYAFENILIEILDVNTPVASQSCVSSPCQANFNLTLGNFDSEQAILHIQIETDDQNINRYVTYLIMPTQTDPFGDIRGLRNTLGHLPLALLMFLTIFLIWEFIGENALGNNSARIFIIAIIPGIFIAIWWYDIAFVVLGYLSALLGAGFIYLFVRSRE